MLPEDARLCYEQGYETCREGYEMGKRTETYEFMKILRFGLRRYRRLDTALTGALRFVKKEKNYD